MLLLSHIAEESNGTFPVCVRFKGDSIYIIMIVLMVGKNAFR
jgi:hypothetical protein